MLFSLAYATLHQCYATQKMVCKGGKNNNRSVGQLRVCSGRPQATATLGVEGQLLFAWKLSRVVESHKHNSRWSSASNALPPRRPRVTFLSGARGISPHLSLYVSFTFHSVLTPPCSKIKSLVAHPSHPEPFNVSGTSCICHGSVNVLPS